MGLAGIPRVRYGYHDKYHGRKYLGYSTAQSTAGTGMGLRPSYQAWYTVYTFTMYSLDSRASGIEKACLASVTVLYCQCMSQYSI